MGRYSCPVCRTDVPPVSVGRVLGGELIPPSENNGLAIEKKRCPECALPLERTAIHRWHVAGSLERNRELATDFH
jgi:hypothetical protein